MKYFLRPSSMTVLKIGAVALLAAGSILVPHSARAQLSGLAQILEEPSHLLHSSSPGYMGVLVSDVDSDSASRLRLKETRGALVTLIDHDAPAAQAGIRVNDVLLQVNGQNIENAEQFIRIIREIPAGHTASLLISRDGASQTISVQLCDRKKMEQEVWSRLDHGVDPGSSSATGNALLSEGGDVPSSPGGIHLPWGSTLNVGALVEPLDPQMADYLGLRNGLMIKQIAHKSEAEAAGLKPFDVILKVGTESIATLADWDRTLRANQNKPVAVTILRDRKQQTVTLQVDSKHRRSALEDLFPDSDCPLMAALDPEIALQLAQQLAGDDSAMQSMRDQAESLRDQSNRMQFQISPERAEQFRKQLEEQAQRFRENFRLDQQQIDELKKQMDQFKHDFQSPELQQKLQDEMKRQMDQLKRQLEEMQAQGFDHMV
jgi:serine protease Do